MDPVAARIQGIPVKNHWTRFSVLTALVVVSMVKGGRRLVGDGTLGLTCGDGQTHRQEFPLVCLVWSLLFGLLSVSLGIYYSAELSTGSGAMIALVAALVFAIVTIGKLFVNRVLKARGEFQLTPEPHLLLDVNKPHVAELRA